VTVATSSVANHPTTALITGGASGIGLATAHALGATGTVVYVGGRDAAKGLRAVETLKSAGIDGRFVKLDVRDSASVATAVADIAGSSGPVDILVNNAGIECVGALHELTEDAWDDCFDTNLKGAFLCSRAVIPMMRSNGGGVIINNASNAGLLARGDEPAYSTAKAGLIMLTRSMALGYAADRIRVNAVCPGPVSGTGIMDRNLASAPDPVAAAAGYRARAPLAAALGRMIEPEEVAALIAYLCSDAAAMITGAIMPIDAGKSAGPSR
jgi:NAD(P)-dependent dehydrogenase (short-subunit alcohol dehydrogenase family)